MCPIVAPSSLRFYKNLILHDELGTVKLLTFTKVGLQRAPHAERTRG